MTDAELIQIGADMRRAQKEYFRTRDRTMLSHSKQLEKMFDAEIKRRDDRQPDLPF